MAVSRKLILWLLSFGGVLIAYLLCARTNPLGSGRVSAPEPKPPKQVDWKATPAPSGRVGQAKIGPVETARFILKDREWGFAKLLNPQEGQDQWELEKPYMKVFNPGLYCYITADRGLVQVEQTAPGKFVPKQAALAGNVRLEVPAAQSRSLGGATILLEDVVFTADKSEFSTDGPVRFFSDNAEMSGTGLVAVYNEQMNRLESLKIINLELLRAKLRSLPAAPKATPSAAAGPTTSATELVTGEVQADSAPLPPPQQKHEGLYYRCILKDDVVIEYGSSLSILADEVHVHNILWQRGPDRRSPEQQPAQTEQAQLRADNMAHQQTETDGNEPDSKVAPAADGAPGHSQREQPAEQEAVELVVRCKGGVEIAPMWEDEPAATSASSENVSGNERSAATRPGRADQAEVSITDDQATVTRPVGGFNYNPDGPERPNNGNLLRATRIDYDLASGNAVARGPVEFTFFGALASPDKKAAKPAPVTVSAEKHLLLISQSRQAVFEGGVVATTTEQDAGQQRQSKLCCDRLVVTFADSRGGNRSDMQAISEGTVSYLTAQGDTIRLEMVRMEAGEVRGGMALKCRQLDYDAAQQQLLAAGPGVIKIDNSGLRPGPKKPGKFGLERPGWALIENFAVLRWFRATQRITAQAQQPEEPAEAQAAPALPSIHIGYVPIVDGEYGQAISINSSRVDAAYEQIPSGGFVLRELTASGGITYVEGDVYTFAGSRLHYDGEHWLRVQGEQGQPCLFNGAAVEHIAYDVTTGNVQADIITPGAVQLRTSR